MAGLFKNFIRLYPNFKILGVDVQDKVNRNLEELIGFMNSLRQVNHIKEIENEIDKKIYYRKNYTRKKIRIINVRLYTETE